MIKLKLRGKLFLLAGVALSATLVFSGLYLAVDWKHIQDARNVEDDLRLATAVSHLVAVTQVERGKSAAYLKGAFNSSVIEKQRKITDEKDKIYLDRVANSHFGEQARKKLAEFPEKLEKAREIVDRKDSPQAAVVAYTKAIKSLLSFYHSLGKDTEKIGLGRNVESIHQLELAKESAGKFRAKLTGILADNKPVDKAQFFSIYGLKSSVNSVLGSSALVLSEKGTEKLQSFLRSDHWNRANEKFLTFSEKYDTGEYGVDADEFFTEISKSVEAIHDVILSELSHLEAEALAYDEKYTAEITAIAIGVVLCIGLLLLFTFYVIRSISGPINQIIDRLSESSEGVASGSSQLQATSQLLATGASESAASLEETVSSVEELSSMVNRNAQNATEAKALAQSCSGTARNGEEEVKELITAMAEIQKSSKKIEEIINVIDDIAFQTNLLALNAAVEAARAGEQGKGFAVVAEAVRNLAGRSSSAAKDITQLIQESVNEIDRGTSIADRSGKALAEVVVSVKKSEDLVSEISAASQEQATGLSEVSKAMNQLDQTTQRNASTSEETAAAADQMSQQSQALQQLVCDLTDIVRANAENGSQSSSQAGTSPKKDLSQREPTTSAPVAPTPLRAVPTPKAASNDSAESIIPFDDDEDDAKFGDASNF